MKKLNNDALNSEFYYLFYQMMYEALETDDVVDGINKSLYLLKTGLDSGDVVLHKKDGNGIYRFYINQTGMEDSIEPIECIVTKTANLVEIKKSYFIDLNLSNNFKNMTLLHIHSYKNDYILSINNVESDIIFDSTFLQRINDTMRTILKRAEMYEQNITAINFDKLTGIKNRNAYEREIEKINGSDTKLTYGLFDLFRLKYINDNYSHSLGDTYIMETAKILNKYWPDFKFERQPNASYTKLATGNCIYRLGGDEFVLLAENENIELTNIKAKLAAEEVALIDLGLTENALLGLNYGLIEHTKDRTIKETYIMADEALLENKKLMYFERGIDRRK